MHVVHLDDPSAWQWCQSKWRPHDSSGCTVESEEHCSSSSTLGAAVQWVGERQWIYKTAVKVTDKLARAKHCDLVLDGLDTFATVFVNGRKALESDNMFRTFRIDILPDLKSSVKELELYIVFDSAFVRGRQLQEQFLGRGKELACWNGDASRLFVRKAGYNYGWDWGPVLMTAGPWRPVRVEAYEARILDFHPRATMRRDLSAELTLHVERDPSHGVHTSIIDPYGNTVHKSAIEVGEHSRTIGFEAEDVRLWWPVGMGEQSIYTARATMTDENGRVLDSVSRKFGFRRIQVVQESFVDVDEPGKSFCFHVNNVPIFAGGSNWIPIDSYLTNATSKRCRELLELMVQGNQNMIRVWGGGIYEADYFYDICDELGILVWQDFMFACGLYPAHDEFVENVKREAEDNVRRIRSHPCLAIFAGNNEDYQIAESDRAISHERGTPDRFPARQIYEHVLPKVVTTLTDVYYQPGSPWGGKSSSDPTVGDIHQWNVWHGSQEPFQEFDRLAGRFVSEFGMLSLPDSRTITGFISDSRERFPQSKLMAAHTKAAGYERRLALYLTENIQYDFGLSEYVFATQLIQAEAVSTAFRLWRARFRGPGRALTAGALVWQLNDVWPCLSWSIVDYNRRPKAAYYAIKRAMAPIAISIQRKQTTRYPNRFSRAESIVRTTVETWLLSSLLVEKSVTVKLRCIEIESGQEVWSASNDVTLGANRATPFVSEALDKWLSTANVPVCIEVKIHDEKNKVLVRHVSWPEPLKFLSFPKDTGLSIGFEIESQKLRLESLTPVKGLWLKFEPEIEYISDNGIDVVPGSAQVIHVKGLTSETRIYKRYLGGRFGDDDDQT
ncbi:hypothetical protein ACM66B_004889 [Microbotryomycetes sp. NB124-2]